MPDEIGITDDDRDAARTILAGVGEAISLNLANRGVRLDYDAIAEMLGVGDPAGGPVAEAARIIARAMSTKREQMNNLRDSLEWIRETIADTDAALCYCDELHGGATCRICQCIRQIDLTIGEAAEEREPS